MSEREGQHLDQHLLIAGCVMAVIGQSVLLIDVVRPGLPWFAARDRIDVAMMLVWVCGFAMLGVAMINSGNRLRCAYRAGMQVGL